MTRTDELRLRLLGHAPTDRLWGWLGPGLIALVGGVLRFWNLDRPKALVFDETYYVKQAYSLLHYGVEMRVLDSLKKPDDAFVSGSQNIFSTTDGDMVVHPPAGKWLIAAGEWLLGSGSGWGWRFSVALVGTLSILVVGRVARRLFGSTRWAAWRRSSSPSRARTRDVAHRHPRHHRVVLGAVRVRGPARRP